MLSFKIFLRAEKLRQAFGERHFGHFDRDAVFMHGTCDNGAEATLHQRSGKPSDSAEGFDVVCEIQSDPSSGNAVPHLVPQ